MELILASASPRRARILKELGFDFKIIPSDEDESIEASLILSPKDFCVNLAQKKAKSVFNKLNRADITVLGADTIVVLDNRILGKPKNATDAIGMLKILCGRTHEVITGVSAISAKGQRSGYSISKVTFPQLSTEFIKDYVNNYKPFDKAGAYGIQELKDLCDIKVSGRYDNVVGLPADTVKKLLEES